EPCPLLSGGRQSQPADDELTGGFPPAVCILSRTGWPEDTGATRRSESSSAGGSVVSGGHLTPEDTGATRRSESSSAGGSVVSGGHLTPEDTGASRRSEASSG